MLELVIDDPMHNKRSQPINYIFFFLWKNFRP